MHEPLLKRLNMLREDMRILVVGDVMLDRYVYGNAERTSPEAAVLVLNADETEIYAGGAAGVASFATGLGARVSLAGISGEDADGRTLRRICEEADIGTRLLLCDDSRPTTRKERFVGRAAGRHGQHVLRVDHESRRPLNKAKEQELLTQMAEVVCEFDVVLISDYSKGVCTQAVVRNLLDACRNRCVPAIVDPGNRQPVTHYAGASLLKPNRMEAGRLVGRDIRSVEDAMNAATELCEACQAEQVIITLDRDGCVFAANDEVPRHVPTMARQVYDITSAGDMFLAMLGIGFANDLPVADCVRLSNLAAGLEVERPGTSAISRNCIRSALNDASRSTTTASRPKVVSQDEIAGIVNEQRRRGRSIVLTNGCFDLLHAGHVASINDAAQMGDILIVAINDDDSIRRLKGPSRPIIGEQDRANHIAALECVDYVVVYADDTPIPLIRALRPDTLVKGGTYTTSTTVGADIVTAYGGAVRSTCHIEGISTTDLIKKLTADNSVLTG